jgi:hypothetical protein
MTCLLLLFWRVTLHTCLIILYLSEVEDLSSFFFVSDFILLFLYLQSLKVTWSPTKLQKLKSRRANRLRIGFPRTTTPTKKRKRKKKKDRGKAVSSLFVVRKKMKVAVVLSLFLCLVASVQGVELFQNPDMNGCENGNGQPLLVWGGGASSIVFLGNGYYFTNPPTDDLCYTYRESEPGSDELTQSITVSADGSFDFSGIVSCEGSPGETCDYFLTIDGQSVPLTGATNVPAFSPSTFLPVTATGIFLLAGSYDVIFSVSSRQGDSVTAVVVSLSLATPGSGSGDPHMVGFQGQRFDYIGEAGQVINLISDPELQVRFLFFFFFFFFLGPHQKKKKKKKHR